MCLCGAGAHCREAHDDALPLAILKLGGLGDLLSLGVILGFLHGLTLRPALFRLELLRLARLLQLLALLSGGLTDRDRLKDDQRTDRFSPARALLRSKARARMPSAETTSHDSSNSQVLS